MIEVAIASVDTVFDWKEFLQKKEEENQANKNCKTGEASGKCRQNKGSSKEVSQDKKNPQLPRRMLKKQKLGMA